MGTKNIEGENWSQLEKQIQSGLQNGVVHYPGTAKPGEYGNLFMTGHSSYYPWDPGKFKDVFATLNKLEVGDRYYVYYGQIKYTYEVFEKKEVQPGNVDVLKQPVDQKISTLMTCTPVGTALRRLIITAQEV
ncbi:MAG: sortase [Candidatus Magasanikbacteria bacterium]|nr:sortase [Candidatus Magasanikbacteria bacterium]